MGFWMSMLLTHLRGVRSKTASAVSGVPIPLKAEGVVICRPVRTLTRSSGFNTFFAEEFVEALIAPTHGVVQGRGNVDLPAKRDLQTRNAWQHEGWWWDGEAALTPGCQSMWPAHPWNPTVIDVEAQLAIVHTTTKHTCRRTTHKTTLD